jgi:hypothetical protein
MINELREIYSYVKPEELFVFNEEPCKFLTSTNRRDKRLLIKIEKQFSDRFAKIVDYFYDSLFLFEKDYKEVYNECLGRYIDLCERFADCRLIELNDHYFVKMYKPLEN